MVGVMFTSELCVMLWRLGTNKYFARLFKIKKTINGARRKSEEE